MRNLETTIRGILTRRLGVLPAEIAGEARLIDDLGLDSVDLVELAISIESELGLTLDDDYRDVTTVDELIRFVEDRLTESARSQ